MMKQNFKQKTKNLTRPGTGLCFTLDCCPLRRVAGVLFWQLQILSKENPGTP